MSKCMCFSWATKPHKTQEKKTITLTAEQSTKFYLPNLYQSRVCLYGSLGTTSKAIKNLNVQKLLTSRVYTSELLPGLDLLEVKMLSSQNWWRDKLPAGPMYMYYARCTCTNVAVRHTTYNTPQDTGWMELCMCESPGFYSVHTQHTCTVVLAYCKSQSCIVLQARKQGHIMR